MKFSEFEKKRPVSAPIDPAPTPVAPESPPAPEPMPLRPARAASAGRAAFLTAVDLAAHRRAAHGVYGRAISAIKALVRDLERQEPHSHREIAACVDDFVDLLSGGNQALVAMTAHSTASNYLYAHSVNIAILSVHVGIGLGWEGEPLRTLGLAAILHDVGMIKYLGLTQKPRALTREEFEEVRLHPVESQKLLEYLHDIEQTTKQTLSGIIGQEHERKSGKGYPHGLSKGDDLHTASQVIGLCDIYEAMSHPRSWREAALPSNAIKELIRRHSDEFSRPLMQAFLERVSLFPPGAYVQLVGGEVAVVVAANAKLPTRPVVEIKVRQDQLPQDPGIIVNLADAPLMHIRSAVDETKILVKDKKTAMALQAHRWWVE